MIIMPRLQALDKYYNIFILDFCSGCWPPESFMCNTIAKNLDIPAQIIENVITECEDVDHPPYSECGYECVYCNQQLTDLDD
jgi:hypothetical protein